MKRVCVLTHQGQSIIYADFSNVTIFPKCLVKELMNLAKDEIMGQSPGSALILTNLTGLYYDREIIDLFQEYFIHNKPYIKASAVIGYPADLHDVLDEAQNMAGRSVALFDNENEALDWLVQQ